MNVLFVDKMDRKHSIITSQTPVRPVGELWHIFDKVSNNQITSNKNMYWENNKIIFF